MGFKHSLIET